MTDHGDKARGLSPDDSVAPEWESGQDPIYFGAGTSGVFEQTVNKTNHKTLRAEIDRVEQYCHDVNNDVETVRRESGNMIEAATKQFGQHDLRLSALSDRIAQLDRRLECLARASAPAAQSPREYSPWDSWYVKALVGFVVISATPMLLMVFAVVVMRLLGVPHR